MRELQAGAAILQCDCGLCYPGGHPDVRADCVRPVGVEQQNVFVRSYPRVGSKIAYIYDKLPLLSKKAKRVYELQRCSFDCFIFRTSR